MSLDPFDDDPDDGGHLDDGGVLDDGGHLGDVGIDRAPICGACGVTALPAEGANVSDTTFVCGNEGCEAFGEVVAS